MGRLSADAIPIETLCGGKGSQTVHTDENLLQRLDKQSTRSLAWQLGEKIGVVVAG